MKFPFKAVVDNLNDDIDDYPGLAENMRAFLGKSVSVIGTTHCGRYYKISEDGGQYVWSPEWFKFKGNPKPYKKTSTTSKAYLRFLLKELREGARRRSFNSTICHYGLISKTKKGYEVITHFNDVCHYRIANSRLGGEVVALVDFAGKPKELVGRQYKTWLQYSDFIINRSYAKDAFIPTRMANYVQHGVMVNLEATATNVMTGLNALRMGREKHSRMLPMFELLTKQGFDEGVAFLMGTSFVKIKDEYRISIDSFHSVIYAHASLERLIQVAAGTFVFPKGKPYREKNDKWEVFDSITSDKAPIWRDYLAAEFGKAQGKKVKASGWGVAVDHGLTQEQFLQLVRHFQDLVDKEKAK